MKRIAIKAALSWQAAFAQPTLVPVAVCSLPSVVDQSSGMEITGVNKIWTHNDGAGTNALYELDTNGTLQRTLTVTNALNVDWEELAHDSAGNFYIGDFGNNSQARQDLKIYKIVNPDSIAGSATTAQVISFSYPDQTAFPPRIPLRISTWKAWSPLAARCTCSRKTGLRRIRGTRNCTNCPIRRGSTWHNW